MIMQVKKGTEFLKDIKRRFVLSERKEEVNELEATSTPAATTTTSATTRPATAPAAALCLLAGLILGLGGVIHEQSVEGQAVGKDVITDCGATNVDGIERDRVAALGRHLDGSEGGVHLRRNGCDCAVENCAYMNCVVSLRADADVGSENRGLSRGRRLAPERNEKARKQNVPFLSSMVTVSLAHFIKKLNDQSVKSS